MHKQSIWLIYDGLCPMCTAFGKAVRIREAVGTLHIINGREKHPIIEEINQRRLNLDEGIVLKYKDALYHGSDALHMLAFLGSEYYWFNRLNAFLFRSKLLAKFFYPVFKSMRNLLLWYNRVPKIGNLEEMNDKQQPIFKPVFGGDWEKLPIVMHKHYANRPYSYDVVTVSGKMNIDYSGLFNLLIPLFKLFKILVPYKGKDIPVTVNFRSNPNSSAFHFDRTFHIPGKKPYYFRSYMLPIKDNVVFEFMFLGIGWRIKYNYDGNKVTLKHDGYVWKLFGFHIPLPFNFILGKIHTEKEALSEDSFRLDMQITHPVFGKYIYEGKFKILSEQLC